ncbi:macrolide family glycosyltransferase [Bacillus paralicheniformis]|uniref:macrolide family glycosyltransferase n=1 Tax=Bacillus paralicheniformis TaxID=1648923 RepID=UPI00132199E1|nr:macrolide family glycosyltransferase [Bacillus paralicheniformis]TWK41963.1 Oleandomycin glycosyltransferase [Bacillus paralicheniformis]TWK89359.1 Oleandomycin glycosyltransferase [Bacillus paralicheniformis]
MGHVLMINFPGEGHINPSLGVTKELQRRGESIVYYAVEEYAGKIKKTGAEVRLYPDFREALSPGKEREKMDFAELVYNMSGKVDEIVQLICQEVRDESYDYVIYDHHFLAGKIIAEMLGLPSVSLCTTFAMDETFAKTFTLQGDLESSPYFEKLKQSLGELSERYPVSLDKPFDVFSCPGDITIVFTSREFQPHAERFGNDYLFVGPSITSRQDPGSFPFAELEGETVIVISMGTIFNQQKELYHMCIEALKDFDGKVVMAVGKSTDPADLGTIPDHFIVRPYIPQLEVLKKADVFVTHGGMNSTNEGLYFDTPLIVIPMGADQFFVAAQVERTGAGIKLDKNELSPAVLQKTIKDMLENRSYKDGAAKIGRSLRDAGGYQKAADAVLELAGKKVRRSKNGAPR